MFKWDYWRVETLPVDYIEELFARLEAQNNMPGNKKETTDETVQRLKAANLQALQKIGVKPL